MMNRSEDEELLLHTLKPLSTTSGFSELLRLRMALRSNRMKNDDPILDAAMRIMSNIAQQEQIVDNC